MPTFFSLPMWDVLWYELIKSSTPTKQNTLNLGNFANPEDEEYTFEVVLIESQGSICPQRRIRYIEFIMQTLRFLAKNKKKKENKNLLI